MTNPAGSLVLAATLLLSSALTALLSPARADVPDPSCCEVRGDLGGSVLVAPGDLPGTALEVWVRVSGSCNPISDAVVQVLFAPAVRPCTAGGATAHTDANGYCRIPLRASGCVRAMSGACFVVANGITIWEFRQVRSPDNASHEDSAPDGEVNTADLPFFADEFIGRVDAACHDYDNDLDCDTADLPYFGDGFRGGLRCE